MKKLICVIVFLLLLSSTLVNADNTTNVIDQSTKRKTTVIRIEGIKYSLEFYGAQLIMFNEKQLQGLAILSSLNYINYPELTDKIVEMYELNKIGE